MNKTTPILNKIKKVKKQVKKIKKKIKKSKKARKNIRKRVLAAAYTSAFSKRFSILKQDGNSMTVQGRDLIYSIPDTLISNNDTSIMTVIPSNPAYWTGTRVAALASGYQNFRPLTFKVHYVPQCAVTQQGNVIAGTLWNQVPSQENLQQSLRTSSGGMLTQCYKNATSIVRMKSNLQYNLYRMGGEFNQESNPFLFIAMSVGCFDSNNNRVIPGYFYVSYKFTFKNPIGTGISYFNSGLTSYSDVNQTYLNRTVINCSPKSLDQSAELGTTIQLDDVDGSVISTINGQEVSLSDEQLVWAFANNPHNYSYDLSSGYQQKYTIKYARSYTKPPAGNVDLDPGYFVVVIPDDTTKDIFTYSAPDNSGSTIYVSMSDVDTGKFLITNRNYQYYGQINGVEVGNNFIVVQFKIPAEFRNQFQFVQEADPLNKPPYIIKTEFESDKNIQKKPETKKEEEDKKEKTNPKEKRNNSKNKRIIIKEINEIQDQDLEDDLDHA